MYVKCGKKNKGIKEVKSRWVFDFGNTPDSQIVSFNDSAHYVEKNEFLSGDQTVDDDDVRYTADEGKENISNPLFGHSQFWV